MTGKLLLGIVLLVVGLGIAVIGITGMGPSNEVRDEAIVVGDQNRPERQEAGSLVLPLLAGLALAGGAFLVGVGMGNFKRPTVVPADSPRAEKAATTRDPNV